MDAMMDRKSFLTGSALFGLGAIGLGVAGCSPQGATAGGDDLAGTGAEDIAYATEENFDVVVVGAGTAGLCAAIRSAELGLRPVLLERLSKTGGTSAMTEGAYAVGTKMAAEAGSTTTPAEGLRGIEEYCHWTNNEEVARSLVYNSADTIEWMMDQGVKFDRIQALSTDVLTWHIYEGLGAQAIETLTARARDLGVDVRTETTGKQLKLNGDGSVAGVVAETRGGGILFTAPVAIMCGGGFSNNPEMMRAYTSDDLDRWLNVGAPDTRMGEGIAMGLSAGGALHKPCAVMEAEGCIRGLFDLGSHLYAATAGGPALWVNERAVRFCDEFNAAPNFTYYGAINAVQGKTFVVCDTSWIEHNKANGSYFTTCEWLVAGDPLDKIDEQLAAVVADGNVGAYQADTLEALADQLGLDGRALAETVASYNALCEAGEDTEFGKDPSALIALTVPPYYGFEVQPTLYTTVGGLKVNGDAAVIGEDGEVIRGLYACGGDAGGVYGYTYDVGAAAGSQQGWAATSGKLAAQHAKEHLFA